jgi:hypothetical protein
MDKNFIDELSRITGKVPGDIQDLIGEMSFDDIYTLMNLVHDGDHGKIKDLLAPMLQKDGALDNAPAQQPEQVKTESVTLTCKFPKFEAREELLGLLEENNISYSFGLGSIVRIHCQNTEEIKLAQSLSDSVATKQLREKSMDKKFKKFSKDSKIVIPASKPLDTAKSALAHGEMSGIFRSKSTPNKKTTVAKAASKHKGRSFDEGFDPVSFWTNGGDAFTVVLESFGDSVTFDGKALNTDSSTWTQIQESLTAEGFLSGVDFGVTEMKKTQVNEGVMGMTALPGLRRMMELAGMPMGDVEQVAVDPAIPVDAEEVPALPAQDAANDAMDMDMGGDDLGMDPDPLTADHIDDGMGGDDLGAEFDAGVDSAMGGDMVGAEVSCSPAYTLIDDALTSIQTNLPDVKISEYKTLIQRLEDLQVQLQQIGKSYLGD